MQLKLRLLPTKTKPTQGEEKLKGDYDITSPEQEHYMDKKWESVTYSIRLVTDSESVQ